MGGWRGQEIRLQCLKGTEKVEHLLLLKSGLHAGRNPCQILWRGHTGGKASKAPKTAPLSSPKYPVPSLPLLHVLLHRDPRQACSSSPCTAGVCIWAGWEGTAALSQRSLTLRQLPDPMGEGQIRALLHRTLQQIPGARRSSRLHAHCMPKARI